eukprot:Skav232393  [mRNA]  locus=scaffold1077:487675:488433:- [translate_table: standard]
MEGRTHSDRAYEYQSPEVRKMHAAQKVQEKKEEEESILKRRANAFHRDLFGRSAAHGDPEATMSARPSKGTASHEEHLIVDQAMPHHAITVEALERNFLAADDEKDKVHEQPIESRAEESLPERVAVEEARVASLNQGLATEAVAASQGEQAGIQEQPRSLNICVLRGVPSCSQAMPAPTWTTCEEVLKSMVPSTYNEPCWFWTDGSAYSNSIVPDAALAIIADRFQSRSQRLRAIRTGQYDHDSFQVIFYQ